MKVAAVVLILLQSIFVFASNDESPKTFLEAVFTAAKKNPKTVSTNEFLESIELYTKATKAAALPSGYFSCDVNQSYYNNSEQGSPTTHIRNQSRSCGLSASVTLFDGGAQRNRYRSALASYEATKASYNTSDARLANTRGELANDTKELYVELVSMRERIIFYTNLLHSLEVFTKFNNESNLTNAIESAKLGLVQLNNAYQSLQRNFEYVVTQPADENIEGLEAAISSLKYPETVEEAIQIATERGPEVLRRNLSIKSAEFNLKGVRASYGPSLRLNAGVNRGSFRSTIQDTRQSHYSSASVGLTLSIPLSPASRYNIKAAEKDLASKRSEADYAIKTATFRLRETYTSLQNQQQIYPDMQKNYLTQHEHVANLVRRVEAGDTAGLDIIKMLNDVNTLEGRFEALLRQQNNIITNLFGIQQVTGILFEQFFIDGRNDF